MSLGTRKSREVLLFFRLNIILQRKYTRTLDINTLKKKDFSPNAFLDQSWSVCVAMRRLRLRQENVTRHNQHRDPKMRKSET